MGEVGHAYHNGDGVERDDAKALEWFRKAAHHNNPEGGEDAFTRHPTSPFARASFSPP